MESLRLVYVNSECTSKPVVSIAKVDVMGETDKQYKIGKNPLDRSKVNKAELGKPLAGGIGVFCLYADLANTLTEFINYQNAKVEGLKAELQGAQAILDSLRETKVIN